MTWSAIERGGFLVNLDGQRFVDESLGYSGCTTAVRSQREHIAFVIFDQRIHHYLEPKAQDYRDIVAHGGARQGADMEALGAARGLDGRSLADTWRAIIAPQVGQPRTGTLIYLAARISAGRRYARPLSW